MNHEKVFMSLPPLLDFWKEDVFSSGKFAAILKNKWSKAL